MVRLWSASCVTLCFCYRVSSVGVTLHLTLFFLSSDWFRAVSVAAAAETHGGAAEYGQRHGRLLPQQRAEPAELGLLRVHRDDPRGEPTGGASAEASGREISCCQTAALSGLKNILFFSLRSEDFSHWSELWVAADTEPEPSVIIGSEVVRGSD